MKLCLKNWFTKWQSTYMNVIRLGYLLNDLFTSKLRPVLWIVCFLCKHAEIFLQTAWEIAAIIADDLLCSAANVLLLLVLFLKYEIIIIWKIPLLFDFLHLSTYVINFCFFYLHLQNQWKVSSNAIVLLFTTQRIERFLLAASKKFESEKLPYSFYFLVCAEEFVV